MMLPSPVLRSGPRALPGSLYRSMGGSVLTSAEADVGEALATYMRFGRPTCACRRVFLRHRAPIRGFGHSITVSTIVRRALIGAGIDSARKGAHLFRHTLATDLLRSGAALDEIGEVLRHQSPNTTALYAKVDLTALRTLALSWPGGVR